jgi:alkaline phosphatase
MGVSILSVYRRALSVLVLAGAVCAASAPASAAERAKNVILFVGDGMGVSTLTAARIYEAQQRGADGAPNRLSFEHFPNLALVQTYSADSLVTDSANGASALLTGHRTISGALGVTDKVKPADCASVKGQSVATLAEQAKKAGLSTGVVSNAAITDATPASLYAHTPSRRWQSDADLPAAAKAAGCVDIARQMLDIPQAQQLDVMLGGGRAVFKAKRGDGRDLAAEWAKATGGAYVETGSSLAALPKGQDRILGLFAESNMLAESQRLATKADAPTLTEMTTKAIEVLSRNPKGYFLLVEGALIDKAHHVNLAREALNETVEFSKAVAAAAGMTDPNDTLILVTADHSHGLTINGGGRDTSILGVLSGNDDDPAQALDGKAIPILMYASGPGGPAKGEARKVPTPEAMKAFDHLATATVPLPSAAHTGEDVAAYARGPGSQNVRGLMDQPAVSRVMREALGL